MTRKELTEQIFAKKTFLCVGLDPDLNKLPKHLLNEEDPIFEFNRQIIDATAPYCVSYKPNLAFYEAYGLNGLESFEKTVKYLQENYPQHFIIADAKRGDIGNTSAMYAKTFFELYDVDALTVAPYMGEDSVTPFLGYDGKWVILLALTSNKGSQDFQFSPTPALPERGESSENDSSSEGSLNPSPRSGGAEGGLRLFEKVIKKSQQWGNDENMMYVVGATQGRMFEDIRKVAPNAFLLVPGVGAQGGSLEEVCKYGMIEDCGLLVNSSRGIIYASNGIDFAQKAEKAAKAVAEQMAAVLGQEDQTTFFIHFQRSTRPMNRSPRTVSSIAMPIQTPRSP